MKYVWINCRLRISTKADGSVVIVAINSQLSSSLALYFVVVGIAIVFVDISLMIEN
jgi:hypothetical protein